MKKIQNTFKLKPKTKKINLAFSQIERIDDLMFELYHFEHLVEVDLSCNRIKRLPKDMSILKNIQRLDISNNLFEDVESAFGSLNTMPNLRELNISFAPSELKQSIEFYLPKLEVLNGRVVKAGAEVKLKAPLLLDDDGGLQDGGKKKDKKFLPHGFLLFDDEITFLRTFHQKITQITAESNSNPKDQTRAFLSACKGIDECVRFSFEYNEKIEEKVKSGEINTNLETYEIKRYFFYKFYFNLLEIM